ncbi:MAG: 30S ribosomal protein S20 [Thermodesulfobacteriota bacterium]
MANHKSALKRNRQSLVRRDRNRANRTKVKTAVKKIDTAIEVEASVEKAQEALLAAVPIIERAAVKGAFHKKTASRKVSRLTKRVNNFAGSKESAA